MALFKKITGNLTCCFISAVFCFLAISEAGYAESTYVPVEEYKQASGLVLEGRYSEAEKIFDDFIAKHQDEPAGALLKAAVLHYRSIDYDDFSLDGEYRGLLETAEKQARKKIDNDENDLWAHYYFNSAVSLKAVWAVTNGKFISGIAKGRSGFHGMSGIISTDERFFDAYLMTGSYRFWKSITIDWLPFVSDERDRGTAEVEYAPPKMSPCKIPPTPLDSCGALRYRRSPTDTPCPTVQLAHRQR